MRRMKTLLKSRLLVSSAALGVVLGAVSPAQSDAQDARAEVTTPASAEAPSIAAAETPSTNQEAVAVPAANEVTAPASPDVIPLEPVLVTGVAPASSAETATKTDAKVAETPQSVSVITRETLDEQNVQSLNQALRFVPGVQSEQFGIDNVYDFFQIRGFSANINGVFRDGLQLQSSSNSFAAFRLEPYGVERIEILRGPASVLYGGTNPGGLVNYVSKRPTDTPLQEVSLDYGSFNWREAKADFSGQLLASEGLDYRITGLARDSGTQVDFEKNNRRFIAPALSWKPDADTTLTLLAQDQYDHAGHLRFLPEEGTVFPNPNGRIPRSRNEGEPGFNGFHREQWSAGWLLEHRFDDTWTLHQQLRYDHVRTGFLDVFGLAFDPDDSSQRTLDRASFTADDHARALGVDNNLTGHFGNDWLRHTVLFGVDYQNDQYDTAEGNGDAPSIDIYSPTYGAAITPPPLVADSATHQSQVGLYAQEQAQLDERWLLLLSGRQDFVSARTDDHLADNTQHQSSDKFTERAGLSYRFDHGVLPYLSYATSFLPLIGADSAGNAFNPETGRQWESGVKVDAPELRGLFTLAAFHIRRANVLTPSPDPNDPFGEVQTGAQRSQGVELGLDAQPLPALHLVGAYTYQHVEVVSSNAGNVGLRPSATPAQLGSLHANYALRQGPLAGLGVAAAVRYQGSSYGDDLNTFKTSAFTLFDAGLNYRWRAVQLDLYAQNLADKTYFAACQNGNCFYGVARTVTGSVAYHW